MRYRELLPLAILAGIALGLGSRIVDTQENALTWLGSLAAPWILASFVLGAATVRPRSAAALATSAMLTGVAAYYGWMRLIEGGVNASYFVSTTTVWILLAPVAGVVFGLAGAGWRTARGHSQTAAIAVGLTSGSIAGESIFMAMTSRDLATSEIPVLGGFIIVGLTLPGVLLREPRTKLAGYVLTFVLALAGLAAVPAVRYLFSLLD